MDSPDHRAAVGQLADDLHWLEDHCRRQPGLAAHAGHLRLAAALARNTVGPFLEGQPAKPLHLAVVGGAGAGKSTVVNFLAGAVVADANPQAGYTRHPTAYLPSTANTPWPSYLGFLGPLQRVSQERPASADEDIYQVRRVPPKPGVAADPLADFVLWDCPDMTTWASVGYVARLVEVAALADVVVYVASDERYNDEVPTQFLHLLVKAGKAVVVVLTKMREADAPALVEHFTTEVLGRLPKLPDGSTPAVPVMAIPNLPPKERTDPGGAGAKYRVQLLNQILVLCESDAHARLRTVTNAVRYLSTAGDGLLDVARQDLAALDGWKAAVYAGKAAFEDRYGREYLTGERFRRFDRTHDRIMQLMELPGAGKFLSTGLWAMRTPYRYARDYVAGLLARQDTLNIPEQTVLSAALAAWLDGLRAEALKRAGSHPVWKQIAHGFGELDADARGRFQQELRGFELRETDDLERSGRELTDAVEKNPALMYTLRGGKAVADVLVVGGSVWVAVASGSWLYLLFAPVGVSATHQAAELGVRGAVEAARSRVRGRREALVAEALTAPLAAWMADWPATGGTSFERLQQVLRRVPATIAQLEQRVAAKAAEWTPPAPPPEPPAA